ncbi:MAG: type IVB secretion system protein IcmH/DotU [Succinivibrionaceae bacterium]
MAGIFNEESTIDISKHTVKDNFNVDAIKKDNRTVKDLIDSKSFQLPGDVNLYDSGLLRLAAPLLAVMLSVPRQTKPYDLKSFRLQLLDLLRDFKTESIAYDYHPSVIEKATYVLCAALDEEIAHTTWGKEGGWVNHSLLSSMFTQRNGGEVFFVLLDKACQQPKLLIDFIILVYILLMLGFKGKYSDTDQNELFEIKSYVYSLIEHYYKEPQLSLPSNVSVVNESKPFVGLNYRFFVLYLAIVSLVLLIAFQIRFSAQNQSINDIIDETRLDVEEKIQSYYTKPKIVKIDDNIPKNPNAPLNKQRKAKANGDKK